MITWKILAKSHYRRYNTDPENSISCWNSTFSSGSALTGLTPLKAKRSKFG